jgi:hypothetical protein
MVKDETLPPETEKVKADAAEPMEVEPMKVDTVNEGDKKEEKEEAESLEDEGEEEDEEEGGGDGGGGNCGLGGAGGGCTADPNFAVICSFIDKFGASCGIPCPSIGELQVIIKKQPEMFTAVTVFRWQRYLFQIRTDLLLKR